MDQCEATASAGRLPARWRVSVVVGVVLLVAGLLAAFATTAEASVPPAGTREVPGVDGLYGVSCAAATNCIAVGGIGPQDGYAQRGLIVPIANGIAGDVQLVPDSFSLGGVSCPSVRTCIAVGRALNSRGVFVVITDGSAGAAQVVDGTASLSGVSCTSDATCVAVGRNNNNRGVAVTILDGAVGIAHEVEGTYYLGDVSCGSPTSCQAVGKNITLQDGAVGTVVPILDGMPGTPRPVPSTLSLSPVSCVSASTCVALGTAKEGFASGAVVPITDGVPGAAAVVPEVYELSGVACTTSSICEAVGTGEYRKGMTLPIVDGVPGEPLNVSGPASLVDVSCPTANTCQAVGQYVPVTGIGIGVVTAFDPGNVPPVAPVPVLTLSPGDVYVGEPAQLTASIAPADATGTVTFFGGSYPECAAVPIVAGTARCVRTFNIPVSTFLTATYSGDTHYTVTSTFIGFSILPQPPTLLQILWGYLIAFATFFHLFGL